MAKALVDELRVESADHTHDPWLNKVVWSLRVCLIPLDNVKVDVVKFFC